MNAKRHFFIGSVNAEGDEDYYLGLCVRYKAHFMHKNTTQKGPVDEPLPGDIMILKYSSGLVAYGEIIGNDEPHPTDSDNFEDYIIQKVKGWYFKNPNNYTEGVKKYGVQEAVVEGSQYATMKEVKEGFAFDKIERIDKDNDLFRLLEKEHIALQSESGVQDSVDLLKATKNLILTGAPGTGKTYLATKIAAQIVGAGNEKTNIEKVQFHPSYDYTDFVEGLRPIASEDEETAIGFERKDGTFKAFCKRALNAAPAQNFVFIIDEINRGEFNKIFGELFAAIDPDYRGEAGRVQTQYQNLVDEGDVFFDGFYVPENIYIIGTMNDIDRSVESMDFAFRRRFAFREIAATDTMGMIDAFGLDKDVADEAKKRMRSLNDAIEQVDGLSAAYHIGAAYFKKLKSLGNDFQKLWDYHLKGLLFEYLRGMRDAQAKLDELKMAYNPV